jgi:hypothetical protein
MLILCVHDIVRSATRSAWALTEREIETVLDAYQQHGYSFVTLDHLSRAPERAVAVTADDGRTGAVSWLLRRARALEIGATAFVVPGWIDNPQDMPESERYSTVATWEQVVALHDAGHHIGSHGLSHVRLTRLATDQISHEVRESKLRIAMATGTDVRHFAAPYGWINPTVIKTVRDAGYLTISSTVPGINGHAACRSGVLRRILLRRDRPNLGIPSEFEPS